MLRMATNVTMHCSLESPAILDGLY